MRVDGNLHIGTNCVSDRTYDRTDVPDARLINGVPDRSERSDLDCTVAPRHRLERTVTVPARHVGPLPLGKEGIGPKREEHMVRVDRNHCTDCAADQFVDRHTRRLALDIPKGMLDPAYRRKQQIATADVVIPRIHPLPKVLDASRILTDKPRSQLPNDRCRHERLGSGRFAVTEDSGIGINPHETPDPFKPGVKQDRLKRGNPHGSTLPSYT